MDDNELEMLRQKRLMEMQAQPVQDTAEIEAQQAQEESMDAKKNAVLKMILSPAARQRLSSLKLIRPEIVDSIQNQLIMAYQSGRLPVPVTDDQLKMLISNIMPKKKDINIKRRHYE